MANTPASDANVPAAKTPTAKPFAPPTVVQRLPGGGAVVRRAPPTRFTIAKRQLFLEHLAGSGNITASAEAAGISRKQANRVRNREGEFAAQWRDALTQAYDLVETELLRRAIGGYERPIVWQGREVSRVHEMDTGLMLKMLALRRSKEAAGPARPDAAEVRRRIDERLDELAERLRAPLPAGLSAHERSADDGLVIEGSSSDAAPSDGDAPR